jgi:hypothetical protein
LEFDLNLNKKHQDSLPMDSNPTLSSINPALNLQDAEITENLNTKNEESKNNENIVNLNMNRGYIFL